MLYFQSQLFLRDDWLPKNSFSWLLPCSTRCTQCTPAELVFGTGTSCTNIALGYRFNHRFQNISHQYPSRCVDGLEITCEIRKGQYSILHYYYFSTSLSPLCGPAEAISPMPRQSALFNQGGCGLQQSAKPDKFMQEARSN